MGKLSKKKKTKLNNMDESQIMLNERSQAEK